MLSYHFPGHPLNRKGNRAGEIIGGNLSILYSILGTSSGFNPDNKILFIEDVGEELYALDRMLWNLKSSGVLQNLKALLVGGFTSVKDTNNWFPNQNIEVSSYNSLLKQINTGGIINKNSDSLKITTINFEHPLFNDVFVKEVKNFEYPTTVLNYNHDLQGNAVLLFENKTPFLHEITNSFSKIYLFSSPLNIQSSNFVNSPLVVPTLYNIARQSLELNKPYYILHKENTIEIRKKIEKRNQSLPKTSSSYML